MAPTSVLIPYTTWGETIFVVAFQFCYTLLCNMNAEFDKKKIALCKQRCKKVRILLTKIEALSILNLTELKQLKQFSKVSARAPRGPP